MLGVMSFATAESGRRLETDDLAIAENLAERAALAIDNARLYTELREAQSELRRSRDEVETVLENVGSAIIARDPSGRFVYANDAAVRMLRFPSLDALLETSSSSVLERFEIFDEAGSPMPSEELPGRVALKGSEAEDTVVRFRERATGREYWSMVRATPIFDENGNTVLVISIFDDITERKQDELAQRFLAESSKLLAASLDFETTLDNVAHLAVPNFADWCAVDLLDESGALNHVAFAHVDPSKIEMAEEMRRRYPADPDSPQGTARVIRTGESELYSEVFEEQLEQGARDDRHRALLREIGIGSSMITPMVAAGRTIGAITFGAARAGRFAGRDLSLAEELARRAATAVENARLYADRSHIAQTLQRSLLPPVLPDIPGVEVAARFRPAGEGYEVGGDFYDMFNTGEGGWAVVIGDVCGKGPEAASLTALARYTIRANAMLENDPSRILELLSEAIMQGQPDSQFCTAAYGRLELKAVGVRLTVASGGHPLPLLITKDGEVDHVGVPGTLLGLVPETELTDQSLELEPGACLVFYTDGVIEAGNPRGSFGIEGLKSLLRACAGLGAQEIADRIDGAVVGLEENPHDDVAMLVLRVRE
jgi:serine phosphatase RsbU (regulator of sigma subunit)/PAS domain-containing protein